MIKEDRKMKKRKWERRVMKEDNWIRGREELKEAELKNKKELIKEGRKINKWSCE